MYDYEITFRKLNGEVKKEMVIADSEEEATYLLKRRWSNLRQPKILLQGMLSKLENSKKG